MSKIHKSNSSRLQLLEGDLLFLGTLNGIRLKVAGSGVEPVIVEPIKEVTVHGPIQVYSHSTSEYQITGASDDVSYIVSSADGDILQNGTSFTLTLANNALTEASFEINGWGFTVEVLPVTIEAPEIIAPVSGSENIATENVTVFSSAFAVNPGTIADTHLSTDWEIAEDPDFQTIVASSYNDEVNLTSFPIVI